MLANGFNALSFDRNCLCNSDNPIACANVQHALTCRFCRSTEIKPDIEYILTPGQRRHIANTFFPTSQELFDYVENIVHVHYAGKRREPK